MNNTYPLIKNKNTSGVSELFLKLSRFDTGRKKFHTSISPNADSRTKHIWALNLQAISL